MTIREGVGIKEVQPGRLLLQDPEGSVEEFDECLCTQAGAPPWLKHTGLQLGRISQPLIGLVIPLMLMEDLWA